jgi:hypothetical protein
MFLNLNNFCHSIAMVVVVKSRCHPILAVRKENINKTDHYGIQSQAIASCCILFCCKCNATPIGSIQFHCVCCRLILPNHLQAKQNANTMIDALQNHIPAAIGMQPTCAPIVALGESNYDD